jgi:hypothetical protein
LEGKKVGFCFFGKKKGELGKRVENVVKVLKRYKKKGLRVLGRDVKV